MTFRYNMLDNDGNEKLKFDWFILHRVENVAGESLQKLWIFFLVNGTKDCRLHPPSGIHHRTVRDFTREVVTREGFALFQRTNECLAEEDDGQVDSDAVALVGGLDVRERDGNFELELIWNSIFGIFL